uniref:Pyruvate, phosphate dikinase n=1 Tax=Chromera velia CCMP2878 TaxID=1169474 RepID=A0A0G4IFQ7_9ALVE|eukprot:Cvel_14048.t1-p1 / transcript=Cvel_14048.t1 / gene=Cvel_14048 / organism=Chromera_velia_CCMP2878 / gene_product=Pyruvate, phosphate dikinase, putative / transcript_product=Pyruvate, phosphate dikinase, putative / location=Cvel_scaffold985:5458-16575(-) / protein_length=940 / sequence_SO=supercontig / SO=protein_coding / is_pseudo=false
MQKVLEKPSAVATEANGQTKWVYSFGKDHPAPPLDRNLLGGKGKGVAEMTAMGLPVSPGFVITTEACVRFREKKEVPKSMDAQVDQAIAVLEKMMDAKLGDPENPLLVAVRSGARISMPGMMETVLNLGLNDETVVGFGKKINNERTAWDAYRRFIQMYGNVVMDMGLLKFEQKLAQKKTDKGVEFDVDLDAAALQELVAEYKEVYQEATGEPFPQNPREQMEKAILAVFKSWDGEKAIAYRRYHGYPDDWGTAVVVMAMVFGNKGDNSGTGVGFTRDPATGERRFYGEFLLNAQGEDVVAGIRTPQPVNKAQAEKTGSTLPSLEEVMPSVYNQLEEVGQTLETHFQDMQDVEFTIDEGRLFMLQTRAGKRTGVAAVKVAYDMLKEGLIDEEEALMRVEPSQLTQLLFPIFADSDKRQAEKEGKLVARGLNAGPGAASGVVAMTSKEAIEFAKKGIKCVLLREETSPEDFAGMVAAQGILTQRGGATSHAAVVARGLGKPCVCGCAEITFDEETGTAKVAGQTLKTGDPISIDGSTGEVFIDALRTRPSEILQVLMDKSMSPEESETYQQYATLMDLADKHRRLDVRTNADTPDDTQVARAFGAQGIGLVRTEHMFMEKKRLLEVRKMLFSTAEEDRREAVAKLLPFQKADFKAIFKIMDGLPVNIRLLDPPLHEFLPHSKREFEELRAEMGVSTDELEAVADSLREANPMLGHRGCRLGICYPYLTEMQVEAIFQAAVEAQQEGIQVFPEVMVPLVGDKKELDHQKGLIQQTTKRVFEKMGAEVPHKIGTMIEVPRGALQAEQLAESAEYFSFGTNDLTQCTFGMSRDDANSFLPVYTQGVEFTDGQVKQILDFDPFQTVDQTGVGELVKIAMERGNKSRPGIKCGICGEHGGEARGVKFFHRLGLHYVSCSPFRVPVARLAAGQAAIEEKRAKGAEGK